MLKSKLRTAVLGAALAALALPFTAGPASAGTATPPPYTVIKDPGCLCPEMGKLNLYAGGFTGDHLVLTKAPDECTNLPFAVHATMNMSDSTVFVYEGPNCTGFGLGFPYATYESFMDLNGISIRSHP